MRAQSEGKFSSASEKLCDEMKDAAGKADGFLERTNDNLAHMGEEINAFAHKAGEQTRAFMEEAQEVAGQTSDKLVTRIKKEPVESALIALGAGFILGALLRR